MKNFNWYNIFLHVMLIGLSIVVILLINKNNTLIENSMSDENIKIGDVFQNFVAYNLDGKEEFVDFKQSENKLIFI